jgi:hypothetical protein
MIYVLIRKKKNFYGDENYQWEVMHYTPSSIEANNWFRSSTQDEEKDYVKVYPYQGESK